MPDAQDDWRMRAACAGRDPELWFPDKIDHLSIRRAKSVCVRCPVTEECSAAAVARNEEYGIWGGKTYDERTIANSRFSGNVNHGTLAGFRLHAALGDSPCVACQAAEGRRKMGLQCGTPRGYASHRRAKEDACQACRSAHTRQGAINRARRKAMQLRDS
jgi:WhiB family redox-sensing transcriptional regulator